MSTASFADQFAKLRRGRNTDILFAIGLIGVLALLFLPVPAWVLDLGLAASLALAVVILMTAIWIDKPLDFSAFPMVLLIATTLRLALNIASTRLILSQGHEGEDAAGAVIEGFAQIIIGGNFVIGLIVFAILVVVNFIVITKGSTRIAEVGARFALDAVPGKQMAIDADLSAGLIDDQEARRRRQELEDESAFYGSMDGASKFVRGDAVAGLVITFINVIGGMVVGVAQNGMGLGAAGEAYTILTVGDGLASQAPALIVSLAAGLVVAKGRNAGSADVAVVGQLSKHPKAVMMTSGLLVVLGVTPGVPALPFMALGGGIAFFAWRAHQARMAAAEAQEAEEAATTEPTSKEETAEEALRVDALQMDLGSGLVPLIRNPKAGLAEKVKSLRTRFAREFGFLTPPVRIRDDVYLAPEEYRILIHGVETARGRVRPEQVMVINPGGGPPPVEGESATEPAYGLPAVWIDPARGPEAEALGATVVDASSVITTHLARVVKDQLNRLLTYAALQKLVERLDPEYAKLLSDISPAQLPPVAVQRILQNLLSERVSIRNLPGILEAIAEAVSFTRNIAAITEHVRTRLGDQIIQDLVGAEGELRLVRLTPEWEQVFAESIQVHGEDKFFAMPPTQVQEFVTTAGEVLSGAVEGPHWPAVLCSTEARPFVRALLERAAPAVAVISHAELPATANLKHVGQV